MKPEPKSAIPILLAFIGLAACVVFGKLDSHREQSRPPTVSAPQPKHGRLVVPKPPEALPENAPATKAAGPNRVILVTLDGWHVRLTDRMPVWKELEAAGATTLTAEVPRGATTVISHAALYTGADPDVNGVNREPRKGEMSTKTVHGIAGRWLQPPLKVKHTLFTAVEAAGYKATAAVQKGKLLAFFRPDASEAGIMSSGNDGRIIRTACGALDDADMRLVVLHIALPDYAGHKHGWLTERQYEAAEKVDGYLRDLRACIADAERAGGIPTTLIVTTDHGGTPGTIGHGKNDADNRLVPLAIVGPGVKPGHRIAGKPRLVDVSATVLHILGIPPSSIPTLSGVPIDEVFVRP